MEPVSLPEEPRDGPDREVLELCGVFQWMSAEASCEAARDPGTATAFHHEIGDALLYVIRLADLLGVTFNAAAIEKLRLNAEKYLIHATKAESTRNSVCTDRRDRAL